MLNERELSSAIGSTAYDSDGDRIGTVEHFFVDDRTGAATWVAVTTGLFGTTHSVVPALDATFADGDLRLPVQKAAVKSSPQVPDTGRLDPATETELRRHYGIDGPAATAPPPEPTGRHAVSEAGTGSSAAGTAAVQDEPVAPPQGETDDRASERGSDTATDGAGDGAMTRSEERLRVDTERVPARRVRLVKYVVTEDVQVTVPLRREEVRIEELPLEGEPAPLGDEETLLPQGADAGPGLPDEIVLHAERPVVTVEVVPVERVRLRTEEVRGQEQVSDRLQREQIVLDRS